MRRAVPLLSLLAALLVSLPAQAAPIRIVAAENFYGDLASQIGGAAVEVTSILANPDQDPHLFETAASTARLVAGAAIVLYNGGGYDPWMDRLLSAGPGDGRTAIVAAELVGARDGDNPHLWYKPETLPAMARALAGELERRDPAHADKFRANLQRFDRKFAAVMQAAAAIRASHAGTPVTATEPVFGYMAEAMGLDMRNMAFQTAMMNETEPAPKDVVAFEASLKDKTVKILFYNSQVTDGTTARLLALAKSAGVPVIGVTETEPAGQNIEGWFGGEIRAVAEALAKADS